MMTARGRGYSQDWDPMRDDFDDTSYDPQHPDDNSGGYVNLDHCRLYITHIPLGLNDEGLSTAFSRFGNLTEVYIHKDPAKRYGLVGFETPGEAKLAMMKLNRTDPLKLNISIAHKSKAKKITRREIPGYTGRSTATRDREDRSYREDSGSVRSHTNARRQDIMANGDNMEDLVDDDPILSCTMEPDTNLELEQLRLEHLKLQDAQVLCKQRMLLLKQAERKSSSSSRCVLPDGRVVVRNVERVDTHDGDASFGAGAGDAPKIPGLQSFGVCVACGERASAFCAGCRVTPYCSPACQRRDWADRHKKVCHNLKRIPTMAPLRRPHTPEPSPRDEGSDRAPPRRFGPPGNALATVPTSGARNAGPRGNQGRANQSFDGARSQDNRNKPDNKARLNRSAEGDMERSNGSNDNNRNGSYGRQNNERFDNRNRNEDGDNRQPRAGYNDRRQQDESDGGPTPAPKPAFKPKPPVVQKEEPKPETRAAPEVKTTPEVIKARVEAKTAQEPVVSTTRPLASPADVLPVSRKLVPKNCVLDLMAVGTTFIASVDYEADDTEGGWLCLTLSDDLTDIYAQLIEPLAEMCEASEPCHPRPGDVFGYLNEDGWYRARCLSRTRSALIDAGRCLAPTPANCRRLPAAAADIPEFSCRLYCDKLQLTNKLECTIVSKSNGVLALSIVNQDTGAVGTGSARRWLPAVEPQEAAPTREASAARAPAGSSAGAAAAACELPSVGRPPVANNSAVLLVDATEPARAFVRPARRDAQAKFDDLVCEVAMYGLNEETPHLTELPIAGQTVVARFTDGNHYRALVLRVSSKTKRCLLEYIEYGNVAAVDLDKLCPCPPQFELAAAPTLTSLVALDMKQKTFTDAATEYLDKLKDEANELTLTIPSGDKTGPSGTAVRLTVIKTGEDVNRKVDSLSTPEWVKIMERGGDVLQVEKVRFNQVEYVHPPASGGQLDIVDSSALDSGLVSGHERGAPHALRAYNLTKQLAEYCNSELAKDPYLPSVEELCIAKCPEKQQWLRAVFIDHIGGPGGLEARLLFYDHGHVDTVSVADIRKMMPEFALTVPAAACSLEIKDFPPNPTAEQLSRAKLHMQLNERGCGVLAVTSCRRVDAGEYVVEAPELIRAMQ